MAEEGGGTSAPTLHAACLAETAPAALAMGADSSNSLAATAAEQLQLVLDPYTCIPKRNQKYACDCTEVYLADQDAESLSENFQRFPNLEVAWLNMNRLTRLDNLDMNFRIREVFLQDNMLVSLSGLKNCKFLKVMLASNNQLRNLEKQLQFISRFAFLKKLELSGNPIADEPEYRLRLIYTAPQVDIFDCAVVKGPERIKASDVVPNMDSVSGPPPKKGRPKKQLSQIERDVFRERREIHVRAREKEDEVLTQMFSASIVKQPDKPLQHRRFNRNAQAWSTPRQMILQEQPRPTAWEMPEMLSMVEALAGKPEMSQEDLRTLVDRLALEGVEDLGRSLTRSDALDAIIPRPPSKSSKVSARSRSKELRAASKPLVVVPKLALGANPLGAKHPLEALLDPENTMPTKEVAKYLLTLDWHRQDDGTLSKRIEKLYGDAKRADLAGNKKEQSMCQTAALRLEGAKDRMNDSKIIGKDELLLGSARKPRADFYHQSFFRPHRLMDEMTGRGCLRVSVVDKHTEMGG